MARKDFHHPFTPYDIQQDFMEAVYNCIENGKVGIFESPTGTGKSLSLICGSLTWLREHKRRAFDEALAAIQVDEDEPEWVVEHAKQARRKEACQMRADFEARLAAVRQTEQKVRERGSNGEPPFKKRKPMQSKEPDAQSDEEQFVLDEYQSDSENVLPRNAENEYSAGTTKLMEKLGMLTNKGHDRQSERESEELKIYFCSRTHSQLSQFVGELQRVKLPPGLPSEDAEDVAVEALKHLTLGSRKNLCINTKVAKLESQTAINERCMELQQSSTPADQKCPYMPNKENEDTVLDFRDHALARIRDIEDLATVGAKLQICPYYASRPAIAPAEIVTLPYPLLLQKSAREALGISLKGHVVIIDEAHNLINAVEGIYSAQISQSQLTRAREGLLAYLQRFRNRLKGSNRVYVTQVVRVIDSLLQFTSGLKDTKKSGGTVEPAALLSGKGIDQVNLTKLVRYINDSKLARKVEGYAKHIRDAEHANGKTPHKNALPDVPTLTHVQNFLMALMNPSREGHFFWSAEADNVVIRYLLLDPSEHFRNVVESARAVILAGGTMSPMDEYIQQLFPHVKHIETLSCGHLIPRSNLLVRTLTSDKEGPLDFSFKGRNNPKSAARIGEALLELASHVKGGLVVFFPSYGYLDQVVASWRRESLFDRLHKLKPVLLDSRIESADETFREYIQAVKSGPKGAILLSVIGGKLSEGINFSGDLGRCVVVIGLPFPNLETPEWKAKMQYIDEKSVARGETRGRASREHAENVCMRSVNQAIGRVIRHKDDWASILLMDSRYSQDRIKSKLPGWIKKSLPAGADNASSSVRAVTQDVVSFFATKTQ